MKSERASLVALAIGIALAIGYGPSLIRRFLGLSTNVPENAPEECPGVNSDQAGKADACEGCPNRATCSSGGAKPEEDIVGLEIKKKLVNVKRKILVLSGKGGVGKSTVAVQLSWALESMNLQIGLLDIDICGPSIPYMTGVKGYEVHNSIDGWTPVYVSDNLAVMSVGFMLPDDDSAVIWRGPKKGGLIRQFLTDVQWGSLDFLIIDTPPGTSDEHLSIVQYLNKAGVDGALIVTTPQEVSLQDVRKEINFCKKTGIKVIGVIENMTGELFTVDSAKVKKMCDKMQVPYFGKLSMDRAIMLAGEKGCPILKVDKKSNALNEISILKEKLLRVLNQ